MDIPQRKHPRLKAYDYSQNGMYFVTICTRDRMPVLGTVRNNIFYPSDWGGLCCSYLEEIPNHYEGVCLDQYVVMPDHIHVLLLLDDAALNGGHGSGRPTLMNIIHAFKRLTAKAAGADLWQSSFYEHVVRNEPDLHEIRVYIQNNPVTRE